MISHNGKILLSFIHILLFFFLLSTVMKFSTVQLIDRVFHAKKLIVHEVRHTCSNGISVALQAIDGSRLLFHYFCMERSVASTFSRTLLISDQKLLQILQLNFRFISVLPSLFVFVFAFLSTKVKQGRMFRRMDS